MSLYAWALLQLDAQIIPSQLEMSVLLISPHSVREVSIPVEVDLTQEFYLKVIEEIKLFETLGKLKAIPGVYCKTCSFLSFCPEVNQSVER